MTAFASRLDSFVRMRATTSSDSRKITNSIISSQLSGMPQKSYLNASVVGYVVGLLAAFTANEIMHRGQPALLYLVPSVIISMFITAYRNDGLNDLWGAGLNETEKI